MLETDLVEQSNPDDLPEQSQHQVRRPLGQIVGVDVDNVAANTLGRGQGQGEVLVPAKYK